MIALTPVWLFFLVLHAGATEPAERQKHNGDQTDLSKRGLLSNLLSPNPTSSPNRGGITGLLGGIPNRGFQGGPESIPGGLLDGVTSLLPLGPGNGLNDLLNGIPKYNPAAATAGPRPASSYGDAPWTQSEMTYRQQISCPGGINGQRGVVLLLPPTAASGQQVWPRSPYAQLPRYGFSICWVDNLTKGTGDAQLTAEFVAYAIKYLATVSRRPINVISYSQGGMNMQWALTFWPSIRRMVMGFVALASPFHGTYASSIVCQVDELIGGCLPALFQLQTNSQFMRALNAPVMGSGAVALVPTTNIYTLEDEIVLPQVGGRPISYLNGASNMALQEVCGATHVADHFLIVGDYGAFGIALTALMSGRPANPAAVDKSFCNQLAGLGGQLGSLGNDLKYTFGSIVGNTGDRIHSLLKTATTLSVTAEPPLQMYVCQRGFATGCTGNGFSGPEARAPILSHLPQTLDAVGSLLGGLRH
ncbi:hypothetical protein PGT21_022729 [Puccinia graminis f. sp. tritici]|uniref:Uncharacterized protein n=1 Tax=Puccinia graminis f. sp. tritici TaxID=56615 RepID=A0A5B0QU11_PUCGR|nr:hypothetical protein PGT21_022729 [Puccinia graminis f. sp. tritici]